MPDAPDFLLPLFFRVTRANRSFLTEQAADERMRERARRPQSHLPPRGLRRDVVVTPTERHGWPVYRITPRDGTPTGSLVYAHGGAWVNEVALQHWQLASQLAVESGTTVDLVIYPLLPRGTAANVVPIVTQLVLENRDDLGPTVIAGDSAGGQIALSVALQLRDEHAVVLPITVLISPSVDLRFDNPRIPEVQPSDPWLAVPGGKVFAAHWAAGLGLLDPRVSPLFGELAGLGPIVLFTGTRDILNPDAQLLVERAAAASVALELHEVDGQLHVYPLLPTRAGREARQQIVDAVRGAVRP